MSIERNQNNVRREQRKAFGDEPTDLLLCSLSKGSTGIPSAIWHSSSGEYTTDANHPPNELGQQQDDRPFMKAIGVAIVLVGFMIQRADATIQLLVLRATGARTTVPSVFTMGLLVHRLARWSRQATSWFCLAVKRLDQMGNFTSRL